MKFLSVLLASGALLASTLAGRADPVALEVWTVAPPAYHDMMAKEFQAHNPDVTINLKVVQFLDIVNDLARAVAMGSAPDVTYIDNPDVALLAAKGILADLKPMIDRSATVRLDDILPGPLSAVRHEGGIYGIPRGANTIALFYNADMFRAEGLDPDRPPQTWDDLLRTARTLTDPARNVYGLAFSAAGTEEGTFQFLPWLQMAGGDYGEVNGAAGTKALEFWKTLVDERLASPDTLIRGQYSSTATFNAQNAAMAISGPWELPRMARDAKFDYRVALLPVPFVGAERASALGEGDNVILKSSRHQAEAFRFLEYMYAQMPRVWNEFGYLPATRVAVKDPKDPKAFAVFEESMKFARTRGPSPRWTQVSKAIHTAVQAALTGQETVQQALDEAQSSIDTILGN